MSIEIRMTGSDADQELASLCMWLRDESDVRRHARITFVRHEPDRGEMGSELAIIQLVIDSGFQMLNFALAYAAWRGTRQKRPNVVIQYNDSSVSLDGDERDVVDAILRALN